MNLSIFDNDDTFADTIHGSAGGSIGGGHAGGTVGGGSAGGSIGGTITSGKTVRVVVAGKFGFLEQFFTNEETAIRNRLSSKGWIVYSVKRTSTNIGGVGDYVFDVYLDGMGVRDDQIKSMLAVDLSDIMTVSGITVASVGSVKLPADVDSSGSAGSYNAASLGLGGLGLGLGLSTPIVIGGGVLIAILLLRR